MKITSLIIIIIISSFGFANDLHGQECLKFHKSDNCRPENADGFRLSSLSHGHYLEVGRTVTFEVVLYGENEIIIQCCTEDDFYPVRFKLKSSVNGNIIYDNKYNNYIDNLNLLLDHTESIAIEISIEPKQKKLSKLKDGKVCVGMAIYMENNFVSGKM